MVSFVLFGLFLVCAFVIELMTVFLLSHGFDSIWLWYLCISFFLFLYCGFFYFAYFGRLWGIFGFFFFFGGVF